MDSKSAAKRHTTTSYSEAKANELGVNVTRADQPLPPRPEDRRTRPKASAASVLRRLWDELGAKEQRWLPVDLERDILAVLSAPELATSPLDGGDVGVGNEPESGAES